MPKISVIIPVYNAENYLEKCLTSVITQSWENIEIICIDDGSTDQSVAILEKYSETDARIKIYTQKNKGAGKARNFGMSKVTGDYIHFLDSDDWLHDNKAYEKGVGLLEKNKNVSFLMFGYQKFDNMMETYTNYSLPVDLLSERVLCFEKDYVMLLKLPVVPWNKLYRTSFLKKHQISFDELICANDRTFYFKSLFYAKKIMLSKECLMTYRVNNQNSLVGQARKKHFDCHITAYKNTMKVFKCENEEVKKILLDLTVKDFLYFYNKISYPYNLDIFEQLDKFFNEWNEIDIISNKENYFWSTQYQIIKNSFPKCENEKIVPIVFATNEKYASYLDVAITSILKNATDDRFYDIYVLYDILSPRYIMIYENKTSANVRVQCINVSQMIDETIMYEKSHFSREMYFRFLIPELLAHYEKVLYLDCDLVVLQDIAILFDSDLDYNIVGAISNFTNEDMRKYVNHTLNICDVKYFNSGVLLIDTKRFKEEGIKEKCLGLLENMPKLACPDQDVLNISCEEKIKYLDSKWNFQWHHQWATHGGTFSQFFQKQYDKAHENPYIIHFTSGEKPWSNPDKPMAEIWWKYARQSDCYEEILFNNLRWLIQNEDIITVSANNRKRNVKWVQPEQKNLKYFLKKISGGIQCYKDHGIIYTFKRALEHLGIPMGIELKKQK